MDSARQVRPLLAEGSPLRMALLAALVGIVAGLGAVVFRGLIALFHNLFFFGQFSFSYDTSQHTALSSWGAWVILVPPLGAVFVAFLVKTFAPEAKGHGMPEVIEAVHFRKGVIRPVVAAVKALASSISIGSGAAVGREGPIIQIGAAFGSSLGQMLHLSEWQRITLIAGGAGGGIAATFNTPIGGLLFAVELILPEISARTMIPVAISTVAGTFAGQTFFGIHPSFNIPSLTLAPAHLMSLEAFATYLVLGVILGLVSVLYIRSIYFFEDLFDRIPGGYYTRHTLGMLIVGIMMYLFMHHTGHYYIQGVGYATIQDILNRQYIAPALLVLLLVAKLLATSLSLGSGGSGGIFSPSMFMGAVLGGVYALVVSKIVPGLSLAPTDTAIIGMAALVGGATGAVVTATVMIFEMTRDYYVVVPLMAAVSVAYGVRRLFLTDSIYTMKLARRGLYLPDAVQTSGYMLRTASDVLSVPTRVIEYDDVTEAVGHQLRRSATPPHLLVLKSGRVLGVVGSEDIGRRGKWAARVTSDLADLIRPNFVLAEQGELLFDVVARMRAAGSNVAVISPDGTLNNVDDVIGVLTWGDIMRLSNLPARLLTHRVPSRIVTTERERPHRDGDP